MFDTHFEKGSLSAALYGCFRDTQNNLRYRTDVKTISCRNPLAFAVTVINFYVNKGVEKLRLAGTGEKI